MPTKSRLPAISRPLHPDPDLVRAVVNRRLALRFGLSAPVAAVVAVLAGLGPESGRSR